MQSAIQIIHLALHVRDEAVLLWIIKAFGRESKAILRYDSDLFDEALSLAVLNGWQQIIHYILSLKLPRKVNLMRLAPNREIVRLLASLGESPEDLTQDAIESVDCKRLQMTLEDGSISKKRFKEYIRQLESARAEYVGSPDETEEGVKDYDEMLRLLRTHKES